MIALSERETFLMVNMFFFLIKRWKISTERFLELDSKYNIMRLWDRVGAMNIIINDGI